MDTAEHGSAEVLDPANGPFLGQFPTRSIDVPVSAVFLAIFLGFAATHIAIYVTNNIRKPTKHKFLPSILIFDFCLDRVLSCFFRILWACTGLRGFALGVLIVENGTVVLLTANLFFFQRTIRAMHPRIGWHPAFRVFVLTLIFTTIANVLVNIISLCVSFMSVGNNARVEVAEDIIKVANGINMVLALTPLICIFIASALPGPRPENFGIGPFRSKVALLVFSEICFAVGATTRFASSVNMAAGRHGHPLFSRATFYTSAWTAELLVVIAYAVFRVDRLFHIPNGSKGPGDYSGGSNEKIGSGQGESSLDSQQRLFNLSMEQTSTQSSQTSFY
ncbi:hypothetical protein HIM_08261 [Hirsutella minnesotensis 3608]|uniref:G-protein coupled receptors family 1 profile domain-containing protein n=1 Tax=Hirsutella minnesotensis 3608 TaxID=1043627 RepID=A0A0F7ZMP0_9HYPO|nr:hypothetical protein HIM_08261 [Hirsutella minnesotensis 3608]